jgi:hypothetical protein
MFPSRSTDIASSLPLWGVQDDGVPGVNTLDTFMGGWTSGNAKQYNLGRFLAESEVEGTMLTVQQIQLLVAPAWISALF